MSASAKTRDAISAAIAEFNAERSIDDRIPDAVDSVLLGPGGRLDSLALVHLIVAIEEKIQEQLGVSLSLAEEIVASDTTPFSTLGALAAFVTDLVDRRGRRSRG